MLLAPPPQAAGRVAGLRPIARRVSNRPHRSQVAVAAAAARAGGGANTSTKKKKQDDDDDEPSRWAKDEREVERQQVELDAYNAERNARRGTDTASRRAARKTAGVAALSGDVLHQQQHARVYTPVGDDGCVRTSVALVGGESGAVAGLARACVSRV